MRIDRFLLAAWLLLAPLLASAQEVLPPEIVTFVAAEYPASARAAGVEGVVDLELTVEADGTVSDVSVTTPAGFGFDEAAAAAARKLLFKPATRDGVAQKS